MTSLLRRLSVSAILVGVVGLEPPPLHVVALAAAQEPAAPPAAAALTPGAVALLAAKVDTAAIETVRDAIAASDPMVRAVAARLAAVSAQASLADRLAAAWEQEQDPVAASEQVRALLFVRGVPAVALIEPRLNQSGPVVAVVYAEWLARVQPERLSELLPTLASRTTGDRTELNTHVLAALDKRPEAAERLLRAWLSASTPVAWRAFVDRLDLEQAPPGQNAALVEALGFLDSEIRAATVWSLVARLSQGRAVPAALLDGAIRGQGQDSVDAAALTWEQLGREVITRRHGGTNTPDRAAFLKTEASKHINDARALARIEQITDSERKALRDALGDQFPKAPIPAAPPARPNRGKAAMRSMPTLWPGVLKGLIEAADCKPVGTPSVGVVEAVYGPDGGVAKFSVTDTRLPAGCARAVTALARLTVADLSYPTPSNVPELLILPLDGDYVECASRQNQGSERPTRIGGKIVPPRKVRDVRPVYPRAMQDRGVTGEVVLESTIGRTGCVTGLKVVSSVEPTLDFAALLAVSGWRFTPTTVDGREVPVEMTVSVRFSLQ